jgi:hypothetical protein
MQRSSQSIASLAAALAKAQCELTNPEKSLIGTIKTGAADGARMGSGSRLGHGAERLFRYASLASGLDIVRKSLGQHEIATVQTTAIDQTAGIVNLTTVLAHASGEWIASDWPVCAIADTAEPHRMGAALTYARRYALFTLVGIVGEDDLDAPDLLTPTPPSSQDKAKPAPSVPLNGGTQHHARQPAPNKRYGKDISSLTAPSLGAEESAQLRDRLLGELNGLADDDNDKAALWAQRSLPDKNKLTAADAERVEEAFQARLANLAPQDAPEALAPLDPKRPKRARPKSIDKSGLALPEPRRIRDRDHVRFVAQQPCLICGRRPSDAHHLRFTQSRALGRKVSDEFIVPLCRGHHREVHRWGDEASWWSKTGVDPSGAARKLWVKTHPVFSTENSTNPDGAIVTIAQRPS